jgi:hypothetical protein
MSDDKPDSEDVNATIIMPAQDVGATRIVTPEKVNAKEDVGATVFIKPKSDGVGATQVFA